MGRFGMGELLIILAIVMLIFGAGKIPELAKSMGQAIKEFKKSMNEKDGEKKEGVGDKN